MSRVTVGPGVLTGIRATLDLTGGSSHAEVMNVQKTTKPYRYFVDHPVSYAVSIAGSGGVAMYAAVRARNPRSSRVGLLVLAVMCALQCGSIIAGTERARRRGAGAGAGDGDRTRNFNLGKVALCR